MKRFLLAIIIALSFSVSVYSQDVIKLVTKSAIANDDTISIRVTNQIWNSAYVVDSVAIFGEFKGESDFDKFVIQKGAWVSGSFPTTFLADQDVTLTVNNAAATNTYVKVVTLTGIEGYNAMKLHLIAAAAGNDATDPNEITLWAFVYWHKQ